MGSRRVDLRAILADGDLRRELMVPTLQATQAREGIETTRDQAERAYYVVNEADKAAFFDLAEFRGKPDRRELEFQQCLSDSDNAVRYDVPRRDFSAIEGSPLAYQRVGLVAHIFKEKPAFEPSWARATVGLQTSDNSRFVRFWWEVLPNTIGWGRDWVTFAKGGSFSRFYQAFALVVLWRQDGKAIKQFNEKIYGRGGWSRQVRSAELYGKAGLTWPLAASAFNVRIMPPGCIFANKGPAVFPNATEDTEYLSSILNSRVSEYLLLGLTSRQEMGGRWECGIVKRLPVPTPKTLERQRMGDIARAIHDAKAAWDEGNETSTRFKLPWLLRDDLGVRSISDRLDRIAEFESTEEPRIQKLYAELNDEVYRLYGIPDSTRAIIEETLGERPPEVLWPQMEGKTADQKRMEHVWRLLSYVVGRVVEADEDGIVPFMAAGGETALIDRVLDEIAALFPDQDVNQVEVDITNELKRKVKGYRPVQGIREWLEGVFFEYHVSLYKKRPILWHIASSQGHGACAVGALCHYHKFNHDRLSKLRGTYLRDTIALFRREAALADQEGRTEDRQDWQARLEEAEALDQRLQWVQEGASGYPAPGDCRIRTPWKPEDEQPVGWQPDLDDGVAINILPLQTAGVLRIAKVL